MAVSVSSAGHSFAISASAGQLSPAAALAETFGGMSQVTGCVCTRLTCISMLMYSSSQNKVNVPFPCNERCIGVNVPVSCPFSLHFLLFFLRLKGTHSSSEL